jgi:GR25 family glycosyltransferase involved in LPS biosynthesis
VTVLVNVINLDRTPHRLQKFIKNNPSIPIRRFPAIDGADLDRDQLIRDRIIQESNEYSQNALGNLMSHVTLWRNCISDGTTYHIAEDDALLHPAFMDRALAMLAPLGLWDICYWGWNFNWPVRVDLSPTVRNVVMVFDQDDMRRQIRLFRGSETSSELMRLHSCAGIACYSISPRGAANLLDRCLPVGVTPARAIIFPGKWENTALDVEMSRHHAGLLSFACLPPLAFVLNDNSTYAERAGLGAAPR